MLSDPFLPRRRSLSTPHGIGTVARLGVMPRWLLADADRWRFGSAGRSYRPLRTPPISEHSPPFSHSLFDFRTTSALPQINPGLFSADSGHRWSPIMLILRVI